MELNRKLDALEWCEEHHASIHFGKTSVTVWAMEHIDKVAKGKDLIEAVVIMRQMILENQDS